MASIDTVTVLEHCRISPPPGTVTSTSLQLTRFDLEVPWTDLPPVHILYFYDHPISKVDFIQTIVPKLKNSLSLALKHFYPMAGNIVLYSSSVSDTKKFSQLRYVEGDSVAVTIAESDNDFDRLSGDGTRKAEEFYCLIPHLAEPTRTSDACITPVFALQVTLFPNSGFSLGTTYSHVAFDGSTTLNFRKAWALINRFEGEGTFLESQLVPFYDRTMIIKDDRISRPRESLAQFSLRPQNKARATFFMSQDQIQRLKEFVLARRPTSPHVSSLTVAVANVWSCLAKVGITADDDKMEGLVISADCRARLVPPIPATYFGNCLIPCFVKAKIADLRTNEGLLMAVELIGESIVTTMRTLDVGEAVRRLLEGPQRVFGVAGSPKFDTYDLDFGWGRPKKCEYISIDYGATNDYKSSISVCRSRDSDNLEIGVCLPVTQMEAFARHFDDTVNLRFY